MARRESVGGLKGEGRRAEKQGDWARAIELYGKALRLPEERGDASLDLSLGLRNRIGDLHRRRGETDRAVECHREAAEQYAAQGLHTGAVALCNKILRMDPGRVEVHRLLGRIHAGSGMVAARAPDPRSAPSSWWASASRRRGCTAWRSASWSGRSACPGTASTSSSGSCIGSAWPRDEDGKALDRFERVYGVDIDVRDVADRMEQARSRA